MGLAGCDAPVRPAAPDLKLKSGYYRVEATIGSRRKWGDYVAVQKSQTGSILKSMLPIFQERMKPSNGASSYQADDRPCETHGFEAKGGMFTANGSCRIVSEGKTARFAYQGTSYGDAFTIAVTHTGFGTRKKDQPDTIAINGKWEKDLAARSE